MLCDNNAKESGKDTNASTLSEREKWDILDGQAISAGLLVWWSTEKLLPVNCLFSICSFCCHVNALPKCWTDWTQLVITHKKLLLGHEDVQSTSSLTLLQSDTWLPRADGQPGGKFMFVVAVEVARVDCPTWGSAWKLFPPQWLKSPLRTAGSCPQSPWGSGGGLRQSKGTSEELVPGNTQLDWNPCLASLYESVRFVLFKATFHTVHKTPHILVSGFPQAHVSYLRHHAIIILLPCWWLSVPLHLLPT